MPSIEEITEKITPLIEAQGAFLVDIALRGDTRNRILEIFIDSDAGVAIDHCSAVTRAVSALLDTEDFIQGPYQLVVSSPGTDRPLKLWRQYAKHRGRILTVQYRMEDDAFASVRGTLTALGERIITLQQEKGGNECVIPFDAIVEARVNTPW